MSLVVVVFVPLVFHTHAGLSVSCGAAGPSGPVTTRPRITEPLALNEQRELGERRYMSRLAVHFGMVTRPLCNSGAAICHTLLRVTIIHRLVEGEEKKHSTGLVRTDWFFQPGL